MGQFVVTQSCERSRQHFISKYLSSRLRKCRSWDHPVSKRNWPDVKKKIFDGCGREPVGIRMLLLNADFPRRECQNRCQRFDARFCPLHDMGLICLVRNYCGNSELDISRYPVAVRKNGVFITGSIVFQNACGGVYLPKCHKIRVWERVTRYAINGTPGSRR